MQEDAPLLYLDHAAGTPLASGVWEAMLPYCTTKWGNPSSQHYAGRRVRAAIEEAREQVAAAVSALPTAVTFVGSGSEANQLALVSLAATARRKGRSHAIVSQGEHASVLAAFAQLEAAGLDVTRLPMNEEGQVTVAAVAAALRPETGFLSLQHANNETGVLQPVEEIAALAEANGALLHVDAVQSLGLLALALPGCAMTLSSHKVGGPPGVGALVLREAIEVEPLLLGGHQEYGRRAGTENVAGIVGFGYAVHQAVRDRALHKQRLQTLRELFWQGLQSSAVPVQRNGAGEASLPHILNLSFLGLEAATLLMRLDVEGIACSAGAACAAGAWQPSHVLRAMGLPPERVESAVRFSFSAAMQEQEVQQASRRVRRVAEAIARGRER